MRYGKSDGAKSLAEHTIQFLTVSHGNLYSEPRV